MMDFKIFEKIKKNKFEFISLLLIGVVSIFLRFTDLGFHHYYGDEVKTLFLRKDKSAFDFLMEQRKGPIQFLIVWVTEKLSGGFDEFYIRIPFAVFGVLLVYIFYYFVRVTLNYNRNISLFSTILVALNGIYIAFSRTAQYQMVYLVFGFLSLILFKKFLDESAKFKRIIFFSLATFFLP